MEKTLQEIFQEFQAKYGLSNKEMSDILGLSERMYAYYETGEYPGTEKKKNKFLQKLANYETSQPHDKSPPKQLDAQYWRTKYYQLLEKYSILLEEQKKEPVDAVPQLERKKRQSTSARK